MKRLKYLQFTGTQYINTGITPTNHKTEARVNFESYDNDEHLLGTSSGATYYHFTTYNNKYYWGLNGGESNGGTWTTGPHTIIYNDTNSRVIIDGTTIGSGGTIYSSTALWIGRRDSATNLKAAVYYVKIYDKSNSTLVRDLIPVIDDNDVVCMYDNISETYFYNQGSGSFVAGPEYTTEPIEIEYLQSTGTQWINTGIIPSASNTIEVKFQYATNISNADDRILGIEQNSKYLILGRYQNNFRFVYGNGSPITVTAGYQDTNIHTVRIGYDSELTCGVRFDGEPVINDISSGYVYSTQVLNLFATTSGQYLTTGLKIFYLKVFDNNGNLLVNLMPAKDNLDIGCMYDKVSNTYLYNQGTGYFVTGPSRADRPAKTLEYIHSSGTQYIDTGMVPTNHWLEIKFQCDDLTNQGIFAAGSDQQKNYHLTWFDSNGYRWFYAYGSGESGISYPSGTICTGVCVAKYNYNGELRINNILVSNGSFSAAASSVNLTLFKRSGINLAKMKLFYCKIYDKSTNELVRNFVPAKDSEGIICLYDKVTKLYYYNAGSGVFTAGPEVKELIVNINDILEEKETHLIPENIKNGVNIFGITGNYVGDEPDVKLFDTVANMQADPSPNLNDLAVVYNNTSNNFQGLYEYTTNNLYELASVQFNATSENIYNTIGYGVSGIINGTLQEITNLTAEQIQTRANLYSDLSYLELNEINAFPNHSKYFDFQYIPNMNTANFTNMAGAFWDCNSLLVAPNFDTSNVTDMGSMFRHCPNLVSVPNFNTSNVTNMQRMFATTLGSKDPVPKLEAVPNFDTSNVTDMRFMFAMCTSLVSVPQFNTASVTTMSSMFGSCNNLSADSYANIANMLPLAANLQNQYISNIGLNVANFTNDQINILNAKGYLDAISPAIQKYYHIEWD